MTERKLDVICLGRAVVDFYGEQIRTAIDYARKNGTKVALDVDYRPVLWGPAGKVKRGTA